MTRLKDEPRPLKTSSLETEVYLEIKRTGEILSAGFAELFRRVKLTPPQYNVLRILRGGPGDGLSCGEILGRMLHRDSDITRLLDTLEKRGLVARRRSSEDRRVVVARISAKGQVLLAELDEPVIEIHRSQLSHMKKTQLRELVRLLELARSKVG